MFFEEEVGPGWGCAAGSGKIRIYIYIPSSVVAINTTDETWFCGTPRRRFIVFLSFPFLLLSSYCTFVTLFPPSFLLLSWFEKFS